MKIAQVNYVAGHSLKSKGVELNNMITVDGRLYSLSLTPVDPRRGYFGRVSKIGAVAGTDPVKALPCTSGEQIKVYYKRKNRINYQMVIC